MPATIRIKVEDILPEYVKLAKKNKQTVLAFTFATVEHLSQLYQEAWRSAAQGAKTLPGLPFFVHGTNYPRSIKTKKLSPSSWVVYSDYTTKTGLSVTELLEKGHGLIDLKPGLLKGPKSRVGKNGRYNIVPYTHGSSGADQFRSNPMPSGVEKSFNIQLKEADAKRKAGAISVVPGKTVTTRSKAGGLSTTWGQKFTQKSPSLPTKKIMKKGKQIGSYTWKAGKYEGMYKLQQSTERQQRGGAITFRVVSTLSDPMSWIVPEQEPWPIRKAVIDFMRPFAEGMLKQALEADLQ